MTAEIDALKERAEDLGLETDGTEDELRAAIAEAEAEEGGANTEAPGEPEAEAPDPEPPPEVVASKPVAPPAPPEALPPAPSNPVVEQKKAAPPGATRTYEVMSSFYLMTAEGPQLAQVGGTVRLTEKQAKKYLRTKNIELAA